MRRHRTAGRSKHGRNIFEQRRSLYARRIGSPPAANYRPANCRAIVDTPSIRCAGKLASKIVRLGRQKLRRLNQLLGCAQALVFKGVR